MGTFITNLHVRERNADNVVQAVQSLGATPAFTTESGPMWISVYPKPTESQERHLLAGIGSRLSSTLHRPVLAFLVHDSDVFLYWLFDDGQELDHYDSAPGYFEGSQLEPAGGDVHVLLRYCVQGTSAEQLKQILYEKKVKPKQLPGNMAESLQSAKEQAIRDLQDAYPRMAVQHPAQPDLDRMLKDLEKHFDQMSAGLFAGTFAQYLTEELAKCFGIAEGAATQSYSSLLHAEARSASTHHVD
jgi:hypothetical protein